MNESRKVSELPVLSTPNSNTRVVVDHYNSNTSTSNTYQIAISNFFKAVPGPYANDSVVNTSIVSVGQPYYNTQGFIKIRLI